MSGKGKQSSKKAVVKGRESGKSSSQCSSSNISEVNSENDMILPIHVLKTADNSRHLPRYAGILQRTADEGVGMEDLDTLQLELEMLLSAVVVRSRVLQEEIISLSSAEERRDKRSKSGKSLSLLDKKVREEKSKPKDTTAKTQSPLPTKLLKQNAVGNLSNHNMTSQESGRIEGSKKDVPKLLLPKNDTPNKFWASVEPYCADITTDDIKLLEELIATHSNIGEFKKIPLLGRHYTLLWAHNELMQEEEAANPSRDKKKNRSDVSFLLSKGEKKINGITGPLTQRLVSALLEENVYVANNNMESKLFRDGDPPVLRDLTMQNSINLELRMHKELVEQGILEADDHKRNQEDDEILHEIKRCQQELTTLSNHNVNQLKRLLILAQEERKRQTLKRKINSIDSEIVEHYQRLLLSKQRKTPLNKREQDKAWLCLKERETLLDQLNMLPSNSIGEPITIKKDPTI